MTNTPLNPDARRAAFEAVQAIDGPASIGSMEIVDVAVSAYLAADQPEPNPGTREQRIALGRLLEKALRQCGISVTYALSGPGELYDVAGILLREYPALAAAQPVVNRVESLPAKMRMLAWEGGEFEIGEIPEGHVLVGFEMETDRAWSMADKVTINIERPEVPGA